MTVSRSHRLAAGLLLSGILALASAGNTFAIGERQNIRAIGMGRTAAAVSVGIDAAGTNPANLALGDEHTVEISLAPSGFHAGGDVLTYGLYSRYFTGTESPSGVMGHVLTEEDKDLILSRFRGNPVGTALVDFDSRLFGISVRLPDAGVLALTVTDYAGGLLTYPEDLARFLLNGNPLGSSYSLEGTTLSATWMRSYAISFGGNPFGGKISVGAAVKLVHGYAYYEILRSDSRLSTSDYGVLTGDIHFLSRSSESPTLDATGFDLFPDPAGMGFGFDIGVTAAVSPVVSVAVSVIDIGSVRWTANTEERYTDTLLTVSNPLDPGQQEAVVNAISGLGRREGEAFSSPLPTRMRAGVGVQVHQMEAFRGMTGTLILALDLTRGFHDLPGVSTASRISFGAEYAGVAWLPVRAGIWSGGPGGTNVSMGVGVHVHSVAFDIATDNIGWLVAPGKTSYGSLSFGIAIRL